MSLRTYQKEVRAAFKNMTLENGLYSQVVITLRRELDDKKKNIRQKNITSKDNKQEQNIGLILIMSGRKKISWHVNQISKKTTSK